MSFIGGYQSDNNLNISAATELLQGIAMIASQAEVNAGQNNSKFITPAKLTAYIADKLTGLWEDKGLINASDNPNYPAGKRGDAYTISVAGKIGGVTGDDVQQRDVLYCIANNLGGEKETAGHSWNIIQANLLQATEAIAGFAEIATQTETNAGIDDLRFITPLKLQARLSSLINKEMIIALSAENINPTFTFLPERNLLSLVNGNFVLSKDLRIKPTTTPREVTAHILNFPKPLYLGSGFSGTLFSNIGNRFIYTIDNNGRLFLNGTFFQSNEELVLNINPYIAKFPIEYNQTQPPQQ